MTVRLHTITGEGARIAAEESYVPGSLGGRGGKASVALGLLGRPGVFRGRPILAVGSTYGSNRSFVRSIAGRQIDAVLELRPGHRIAPTGNRSETPNWVAISTLLEEAAWQEKSIDLPGRRQKVRCLAADIGRCLINDALSARVFAVDVGAIEGKHRGVLIGTALGKRAPLAELIRALYWVRGIRSLVRQSERQSKKSATLAGAANGRGRVPALQHRANIALARRQDEERGKREHVSASRGAGRRLLPHRNGWVNVVELFSGAGGMGLGCLLAEDRKRKCRLVSSGEINPIFVETLRRNHQQLARRRRRVGSAIVPEEVEPIDLRRRRTLDRVASEVREAGGVGVLIGGPPCQGFSMANRASWASDNPHNALVSVFLRYVEKLSPPVFLMENVQGIAWTAKNGRSEARVSVAAHVLKRTKAAGYDVFPKLLDAVWYGVPQFRTRFFVLGIHRDLGYDPDDFGPWGPFPVPTHGPGTGRRFVSVHKAIGDLPAVDNGQEQAELPYREPAASTLRTNPFLEAMRRGSPKNRIDDHVTSRHADYVIERYRRIPPGGNWEDIAEMMSNYTDVGRTHSNIYRRLAWSDPSITIGHYRKSMLVHPEQHRGLSLREASRLQSFPDWFRFAGSANGGGAGLMHKQQQLANAVCPLVTKAVAEYVLRL